MYFRLQIAGTIAGVEEWSINPVWDTEGELTEGWVQATAQDMVEAAAAIAIPQPLQDLAGLTVTPTELTLSGYEDATDNLIGVAQAAYTGDWSPTGTTRLTPQSAVVISLRTTTPGASGRGRVYWPAIGAQLGTNLRLATPTTSQVATASTTYFSSLEQAMEDAATALPPWATLHLAVRSKTKKLTPHVTRLMVGDVIDTQRRRRDKIPEAYESRVYPPA